MRKYIVRYLIFWLPAVLVASFYNTSSLSSQILQWFCAFFMLLGWTVNTGMCAYNYPRRTLSLLFGYTGVNILIILALYATHYGSAAKFWLQRVGGIFSFVPLDIFIVTLLDLEIQHELWVTGILVAFCLAGYFAGTMYRRLRPNPYKPRMRKYSN